MSFCVSALGVCTQQCSLPAEPLAAFGSIGPVRQSHRTSPAGDLHPGGHQGVHHLPARVGPRHPTVRSPRVNNDNPEMLNRLCRLCRDGLEDPLDDAGLVQQQLDQLSTIGRCEYEKTCALLVQLFDQAAQSYQELLQSTNSNAVDITVQEGMRCTHTESKRRFSVAD